VPDPSAGNRRLAREDRLVQRARDLRLEIGLAGAADVAHEPLEDAEVRFARRAHRDLAGAEVHRAADVELGVLADQAQLRELDGLLVVRDADRPVVLHRVVEQLQRQRSTFASTCRCCGSASSPAMRRAAGHRVNGDRLGWNARM
jgi:hypothetical protein